MAPKRGIFIHTCRVVNDITSATTQFQIIIFQNAASAPEMSRRSHHFLPPSRSSQVIARLSLDSSHTEFVQYGRWGLNILRGIPAGKFHVLLS